MISKYKKILSKQIDRYWYSWISMRSGVNSKSPRKPRTLGDNPTNELIKYTVDIFDDFWCESLGGLDLPGLPSHKNKKIDAVESILRILPVWAAVISGENSEVSLELKKEVENRFWSVLNKNELVSIWGQPEDYSQYLVDSSDLALSLWLVKDEIDLNLDENTKFKLFGWLSKGLTCKYCDNNWLLFYLTVSEVLNFFDYKLECESEVGEKWSRVKSWCDEDGWFSDGETGAIDYYNAWGFYYGIYWLSLINKDRYHGFFVEKFPVFFDSYQILLLGDGIPMWGRSSCYKYAATVPFYLAFGLGLITERTAVDAYKKIWDYYWVYEMSSTSVLSQGLCGDEPEFFDNYSGPGSSLWSYRSVILDLKRNSCCDHNVESMVLNNYSKNICDRSMLISYDNKSNFSEVIFLKNEGLKGKMFVEYKTFNKIVGFILKKGFRPENNSLYRFVRIVKGGIRNYE